MTFGMGIFVGAGFEAGAAQGLNKTGLSATGSFFLEGGGGYAEGAEIFVGPPGSAGGGKGFAGFGIGAAGGYRGTGTAMYCFNEPTDDRGCKK